jgi:glycosyltransferase involved in cell wall biosynthesis
MTSAFVVVSAASDAAIRNLRATAVYLPNGIDVERIVPGLKDGAPPSIVFVGTVCERKGLLDLMNALIEIRGGNDSLPARVLIIGDARQEGPGVFERIQLRYADAGLDEVLFLGSVDRDRVREILGTAEIFCLPSHWEGSPLSLLEAMAAGAAIVATNVGDVAHILEEGRDGILIKPHDVEALTRALTTLLSDKECRIRLGTNARRRAEHSFARSAVTRRLYELYVEAARSRT